MIRRRALEIVDTTGNELDAVRGDSPLTDDLSPTIGTAKRAEAGEDQGRGSRTAGHEGSRPLSIDARGVERDPTTTSQGRCRRRAHAGERVGVAATKELESAAPRWPGSYSGI